MEPRSRTGFGMANGFVIRNGTIVDGTGSDAYKADLRIVDDRIDAIGTFDGDDLEQIDAAGMLVAPGFVDIHSHSDYTLLVDPRAESSIFQGVTTEIIGNCGHGCFPIYEPNSAANSIYGFTGDVTLSWHSMGDYLTRLEDATPAVNVATLVPNGQLRRAGSGTESGPDRLSTMKRQLREDLEAGAWGYSTGLEYPVEKDMAFEELVELCRVVKSYGRLYATHTRDRDTCSVEAVREGIETAAASGVQLQVSHLLPRSGPDDGRRCIDLVEAARRRGLPVTFDQHTRRYGFTFLKVLLPGDLLDSEVGAIRRSLLDPAERRRLRDHKSIINSGSLEKWRRIRLLPDKRYPDLTGKSFLEIAEQDGKDPLDLAFDLLAETIENQNDPLMVVTDCYSDDELVDTFSHPLCVPGSDATALCTTGPLRKSVFPGAYSWASWFYRMMVNERKALSPEQAIRKMTSDPADIVGLRQRGRIAKGFYADLVIFGPQEFTDRVTLEQPNVLARGVRDVSVNGSFCLRNAKDTRRRSGRVLRANDR